MKKYKPHWKPHMFLPNISDDDIAEACRLLMAYEVATIPQESAYDDIRSEAYIAYMDRLLAQAKAGTLIAPNVPMGWQYYTRKGLAAILIAALLAGIAMPERVMAGYRWLVEVIEEFLADRTKYIYTSNADEDIEFVPMQFGYMPEGMEYEVKEAKDEKIRLLFSRNYNGIFEYFEITQKMIPSEYKYLLGANTEIYYTDIILLENDEIRFVEKSDKTLFDWITDKYYIKGRTNLSKNEMIQILKNAEFR